MITKNKSRLVMAAGLVCAMSGSVLAATGANTDPAGKGDPAKADAVSKHMLASQLIDYGQANKDALALVAAARILKQAPARPVEQAKTSKGGEDTPEKTKSGDRYSAAGALASAREIAKQDPTMLGLIGDVEAMSSRGRANGPASHQDRVRAKATDEYEIVFSGDEVARVAVIGDGDTDLDLYIYDENGNEICRDDDRTDTMICEWEPRWTGPFTIDIKNLGRVSNVYMMLIN